MCRHIQMAEPEQEQPDRSIAISPATRALLTRTLRSYPNAWLFTFSVTEAIGGSECILLSRNGVQGTFLCPNNPLDLSNKHLRGFALLHHDTFGQESKLRELRRLELHHQLIFEWDGWNSVVTVNDLKTRQHLFDVNLKDRLYGFTLDNGLSAGYSHHVHFFSYCLPYVTVTTYIVGRKQLTQTRVLHLEIPLSHVSLRARINVLVSQEHMFVVDLNRRDILQYDVKSKNGSEAMLVRVIDTLEVPECLGMLSDGRLVFCGRENVYVVLS